MIIGLLIRSRSVIMLFLTTLNCFTTNHASSDGAHIKNSTLSFHNIDLPELDNPLQDFEVTQDLFSFKPFKASGSDGLHPHFLQFQWHIVGSLVKRMCHKVFATQALPKDINDTFLCLIPKFPYANNLKNFRPISLCNTIYKVIRKIIVNLIKPYLAHLISVIKLNFLRVVEPAIMSS